MAIEAISDVGQLVRAREARGLSVEDLARQLKLHPRQVAALEDGRFDALPGMPFVRGVIRSYGRVVEANVDALLANIGHHAEAAPLRPTATLEANIPHSGMLGFAGGGGGSRWPWVALGFAGVVAVVLFFGRQGDLSQVSSWVPVDEARNGAKSPASSGPSGTTTETLSIGPGGVKPAPEVASPAVPVAPVPAPVPEPPVAAAPEPPPPPAPVSHSLKLTFDRDAWAEVRREDGVVLLQGNQRAKTVKQLEATGTVSVALGNAEKVRVEFDGKPVDLKPHIKKGGGARLTLP